MAHSLKFNCTSGKVQQRTAAKDQHPSSTLAGGEKLPAIADSELGVSADEADRAVGTTPTSNTSRHDAGGDCLELWRMWNAPGTTGHVDEYSSVSDDARAEQPVFAAHEVEELSDFLQALAEELGSGKLNTANSFTADKRAPKPKLQNH